MVAETDLSLEAVLVVVLIVVLIVFLLRRL